MTILDRLIAELPDSIGAIDVGTLARRLGVQPSALEGMLDLLTRKGLLITADTDTGSVACGAGCRTRCAGLESCPLVADVGSLGFGGR